MVIAFIDDHRARFGVEPICRVLTEHGVQVAPSGYYAFKKRTPSKRSLSDAAVWERIEALQADKTKGNGVAGYRKMWHLLTRDGIVAPRCQVARLMRAHGMQGVVRGKKFVTTKADDSAPRPPDHVKRDFTATRPNQLWIVDFTYVPTWAGMGFTAFVEDVYSRRIVGWRTHHRMPTELPLDALEMALWVRGRAGHDVTGVVHHSDAGSPVHLDRVHLPTDRRGHRPFSRQRRRRLRQRLGRSHDRHLQDRVHPPARPLAQRRPRRDRDHVLDRLVQHRASPRLPRRPHPRTRRGTPLRSPQHPPKGRVNRQKDRPDTPGRVTPCPWRGHALGLGSADSGS